MGQIELKRIELNLRAAFGELVDMNDFQGRPASELDQIRLSRTVAAYALAHVSDIDSPVAANHVSTGLTITVSTRFISMPPKNDSTLYNQSGYHPVMEAPILLMYTNLYTAFVISLI